MKKYIFAALICVLFTACASPQPVEACLIDEPSGFWSGLWHGFIVFFSFIGSMFTDDIVIYDINNTGFWYDLGYFLGFGGMGSLAREI
jgi:hypothetical protein